MTDETIKVAEEIAKSGGFQVWLESPLGVVSVISAICLVTGTVFFVRYLINKEKMYIEQLERKEEKYTKSLHDIVSKFEARMLEMTESLKTVNARIEDLVRAITKQ